MAVTSVNLREACDEYVRKRGQMGTRKAAAHVMHTYGITSSELSAALSDRGLLLAQGMHIDAPMAEVV
jgi:hypothetical protein